MKVKVKINQNSCIGCGTCAIICPEVFEINEDGVAQIKGDGGVSEVEIENKEVLDKATESCPVNAIEKE